MATKKTTKKAKPSALIITPIDPVPEPKRKRKAAAKTPKPVPTAGIEDPLGEPADGEGKTYLGDESAIAAGSEAAAGHLERATTDEVTPEITAAVEAPDDAENPNFDKWVAEDSVTGEEIAADATESEEAEDETEATPEARPPAKLERLQKILSQAGIASRRKAEEMIEEGRVQVNGTVVTTLGTKADAGRDHIRVDGKLLHGAERHRYFVLNKPRGFVTTVKDPEGRPTVMKFFEKMRERLYPVGRLDYMSEGLLLVTNDGDLANLLTKAGSGVEKTYYVKVAGLPTEEELDRLRGGVIIERGQPGSDKVRTSPARIRQVRQGDNPWYEVVLIEGRNRELRKMFSSIGHFVEKIRRVGYGPLVLDVEPGNLRELDPGELVKLKLAAEGKLRTPKAKEIRRRDREDAGTYVKPKRLDVRSHVDDRRQADSRPRRPDAWRDARRPDAGRFEPRRSGTGGPRPGGARRGGARPGGARPGGAGPGGAGISRPALGAGTGAGGQRPSRPFAAGNRGARAGAGGGGEFRPKPQFGAGKPYQGGKPFKSAKPFGADRPARPAFGATGEGGFRTRPATGGRFEDKGVRGRTAADKGRWKNAEGERPRSARTGRDQSLERPRREGTGFDRPKLGKRSFEKPAFDKSKPRGTGQRSFGAPVRNERVGAERPRPPRGDDEFKRPFTPRSGSNRTTGARPGGKPFRPSAQGESRPAFRSGPRPPSGARPISEPRTGGAAGSRPASGGPPNRGAGGSGGNSRPASRGFGKPGERKTGFQNRGGARSSGRTGGKRRP